MSLPLAAIDRLFDRLAATYGRSFWSIYEGVEPGAVKTAWAHELSGFAGNLHALAWALENLPERAPNVIEFRNLARKAPATEAPRLPDAKADPQRVRNELAKLGEIRRDMPTRKAVNSDWAHRIIAKHASGIRVTRTVLAMAQDVAARHPQ